MSGPTALPPGLDPGWIRADSPVVRMVLDHDWSSTPIGPMSQWPTALRTAVTTCLSSHFPLLVLWGPELVQIYNDGYSRMIGPDKHPNALGAPAAETWPEIWHRIGPMFDTVMSTGAPTWSEHEMLIIERNGFSEECYFTFSYSPLYDDDGAVGGVLDIAVETTDEVVSRRRLECIADLNARLAAVERVTDACVAAIQVLNRHSHDVAAADVFLGIDDQLVRVASNRRSRLAAVGTGDAERALASGEPQVIGQERDGGPAAHYAVPFSGGDEACTGVLVATVSPLRPFDDGYRRFLDVIAQTLGSVITRVQQRSDTLDQVHHVNETLQRAMLPSVTDTRTFAARYVPAADHLSIGGDWYDVVDLPDGKRAMVVGDCVGHGLDSATAMAQLRSATRALLVEGHDPAATVASLDTFVESVEGARCASVAVVMRDHAARTLTYCRAGHPPPLLVGSGGSEWLDEPGGPLLGVVPSVSRSNAVHPYADGDVLVLFTDGLVERRGQPVDEQLRRLVALVGDNASSPVDALADLLLTELVTDDTEDDVVLVVKRLGAGDDEHA